MCIRDSGGRDQPLLAAYRLPALDSALAAMGDVRGGRLRDLVAHLRLARVPVGASEALDLDTPEDLDVARRLLEER